jgi:hypothetical protein
MTIDNELEDASVQKDVWTARRDERKETNWIAKIRLFDGR